MTTLTQGERLIVLEEQGKQNKIDHEAILKEVQNISDKLDNLDGKYSSKWVEFAVSTFISVIVLAVIGAIIALVINKKI